MTTKKPLVVDCPNCKKQVIWNSQQIHRPFCSERCKLIDLGEWASEQHKIPGDPIHSELDSDPESFFQ